MTKKRSQRLQTVLRLAELKQQRAAEQLAQSIRNADAQQQQGQQLTVYQQEYTEQYRESGAKGVDAGKLQNFQRFFANLDNAFETQQQRIELSKGQQQQAREQWQQQYTRQQKMSGLVSRVEFEEEHQLEAKLQRELDDRYGKSRKP
jgi:flagellar FliJ protein